MPAPHLRKKFYGSLSSVEKRYSPQGMVEESTHHDRRGGGMFDTCRFQQVQERRTWCRSVIYKRTLVRAASMDPFAVVEAQLG